MPKFYISFSIYCCFLTASNRNEYQAYFGGKKWPVRKADNLATILSYYHVICEPELLGTLWVPRACNGTDIAP
jgi:hypothetical protein